MQPRTLVLVLVVAAIGCGASRSSRSTFARYTCDGEAVARNGNEIAVGAQHASLSEIGDDGDRFVGVVGARTVEYRLPRDTRVDGWVSEVRRDGELGTPRACMVHGGYTDALSRWMRGESMDEIANQLALADRKAAGELIYDALINLRRRYSRER